MAVRLRYIVLVAIVTISCAKNAMPGQGAKIVRNQSTVLQPTPTPQAGVEPDANEKKLTKITLAGLDKTSIAGITYVLEIKTFDKDNKLFTPSKPLILSTSSTHAKFETTAHIKDGVAKIPIQFFKAETLTVKVISSLNIESTIATTVTPAAATKFLLSDFLTTPLSGASVIFSLTAQDPFDNIDTNYRGKVTISSEQSSDVLQKHTFTAADKGVFLFNNNILKICGPRQLTLSDGKITKKVDLIVTPASFQLSTISSPLVVGQNFDLTITAVDISRQICTSYNGLVTLTSSDLSFTPQTPTLANGSTTITDLNFATEAMHTLIVTNNQIQTTSPATRVLARDIFVGTEDDEIIEFGQRYSTNTGFAGPDVTDILDGSGGKNTLQLSGRYDETMVFGSNIQNFQTIEIFDAGFNYNMRLEADAVGIQSINASFLADTALHLDAFAYTQPITIRGGNGDDVLEGGKSSDLILGNDGNNTLIGGYDGDEIIGGAGDDKIYPDSLPFTSKTIPVSMSFWFNASKANGSTSVPAHGSLVTKWQDISGQANHAKNVDGMGTSQFNAPVFERNLTPVNGLPGIRFSALDQDTQNITRLYFTKHFFNSPNATFIGVGRHETCATQSGIFFQSIASSSQMRVGCGNQAIPLTVGRNDLAPEEMNFFFFRDSNSMTQDLYSLGSSNWAASAPMLWSVTLDSDKLEVTSSLGGTEQASVSMIHVDSSLSYDATTTFDAVSPATDSQRGPSIGATASATGSWKGEGWNGHIYEFLGFMTALTENQRNRIEEYLSMKYKLSQADLFQSHDTLTGGLGKDTFYFNNATVSGTDNFSRDQITDFTPGVDKIDFQGFDIKLSCQGQGILTATRNPQFRWRDLGGNVLIQVDWGGDGVSDFEISLTNAAQISCSDFIL